MYCQGFFRQSIDDEYPENSSMVIRFETMDHFEALTNYWDEHYLCKTPTGKYFVLKVKDEIL